MKYDELDDAILHAIRCGKDKFYINAVCEEKAKPHSVRGASFRVVDRRLQALRKRGLIKYWDGKWRIRT
jgi:hypothetical protein